jgi:hypothetical protein
VNPRFSLFKKNLNHNNQTERFLSHAEGVKEGSDIPNTIFR